MSDPTKNILEIINEVHAEAQDRIEQILVRVIENTNSVTTGRNTVAEIIIDLNFAQIELETAKDLFQLLENFYKSLAQKLDLIQKESA
jgi:hypothetical protein